MPQVLLVQIVKVETPTKPPSFSEKGVGRETSGKVAGIGKQLSQRGDFRIKA